MKNWKTSLYGQIIYMAGVGLGLLAIPQMLSTLLHLGPVSEIWVRIVGVLALLLCYYYWQGIRNESVWFAKASCIGRYFFVTCLALQTLTHRPIMQKVRGRTLILRSIVLPLIVNIRFQILFHSPDRGTFHLSLTVLVHYRSIGNI